MTKYKLNINGRSSSDVTLTSYISGSLDSNNSKLNLDSDLAASLEKEECKFGLNELKVDKLNEVCLCEKYNGGCKLCPKTNNEIELNAGSSCQNYAKNISSVPQYLECKIPCKGNENESNKSVVWQRAVAKKARGCCSYKTLVKRVPIVGWLPHYSMQKGIADLIAGITVGLTVIPQAIAYAGVAGLPPQYGLYSSFVACFVYTVFGSVKDSAIGPTAIAAILTRENLHGLGPELAVLLCFLTGCVELIMGVLQLGFLIDFISGPVSVGFTSAAAIIIATSQIKDILGLTLSGGGFLEVWSGLFEHIGETRIWDASLGITCIVALLLLRKVKDINVEVSDPPPSEADSTNQPISHRLRGYLSSCLWFLSTTRNITVVLLCSALAYYYDTKEQTPFRLTGEVKPGLPSVALPPFSTTVGNHTYSFGELTSTLGSAIMVVPLLGILENIALAKVFSEGRSIDATQEMLALGVCNVLSSLVGAMPVSGALSRGAVNHASGVSTTAGGLYTGALVILALQYLTPYFYFIPKASLAAVIIAAVVFMMELHVFKPIWRTKRIDIIPGLVTFITCLATRLELGIVIGIAVNLLFLLYASARPSVTITDARTKGGVEYVIASVDRSLWFPSAEFVRKALSRAASDRPLVLDGHHVHNADFTVAKGIKSLVEEFSNRNQPLILYEMSPSVQKVLRGLKVRIPQCDDAEQLERTLASLRQTTHIP